MNPSVNRVSQSPSSPKNNLSASSDDLNQFQTEANAGDSSSSASVEASQTDSTSRQQPIPPPSNPKQYRAIGLVRGRYQPGEQLTQGELTTVEGTKMEAVILGRVISLLKNHLDLAKDHLWVVYPRTKQEDEGLHVQIVGVWEPETLASDEMVEASLQPKDGYFSVRGEVVYASREKEIVIVKIRQSPKKDSDKPKYFKVKLKGVLPERPVNHFWDLQVVLQTETLVIEEATDLGLLPRRKKPFGKGGKKYQSKPRRSDRSKSPNKALARTATNRPSKPAKPLKKKS